MNETARSIGNAIKATVATAGVVVNTVPAAVERLPVPDQSKEALTMLSQSVAGMAEGYSGGTRMRDDLVPDNPSDAPPAEYRPPETDTDDAFDAFQNAEGDDYGDGADYGDSAEGDSGWDGEGSAT